ncbi:MAG: hypothetical protein LQ346_003334 [Caloplaca aetnensis]|nr:MAG: hypothetical protein LQ346_003334 [Caloplaca aetnensis]
MEGTGAMHNFSNAVENRLVPGSTETSTEEKRLSEGDETLSGSLSALLQRVAEGRVIGATNPVSGKASKTREDHAAHEQTLVESTISVLLTAPGLNIQEDYWRIHAVEL